MPEPTGRRPVVLLSRNSAYTVRTSVTVGIVTRTVRNIPVEVPLGTSDGMPQNCVANMDDILTIPKSYLIDRITELPPHKMAEIEKSILFALDIKAQ